MTSSASSSGASDPLAESLNAAWSFGKFVPGFDFLERWTKSAGAALPGMGQWVAPTLDPQEIDKRIQDLRTVQFWLEQNARMLAMTIQALEVQRMTLDTLKGMNVPVDALRETLKARPAAFGAAGTSPFQSASPSPFADWPPRPAPAASPFSTPSTPPVSPAAAAEPAAADAASAEDAAAPAVDPMRWWGALTQQFTQLAAQTMQDALKSEPAKQAAAGKGAAGKTTGSKAKGSKATAAAKSNVQPFDAASRAARSHANGASAKAAGAAAQPAPTRARRRG